MGRRRGVCYARGMKILLRAVVTGFGLSLGAALYKKITKEFGLGEDKPKDDANAIRPERAGDGQPLHS